MNTLMHCCCGPCLSGAYPMLEELIGPGNTAVYWDNPNIHPYVEYIERMNSFIKMAQIFGLPIYKGNVDYGLNRYLEALNGDFSGKRCAACYRMRLESTAARAVKEGFDSFTTTLSVSPYQNHELIKTVGKSLEEKYNIKFMYVDFRPGFKSTYDGIRKYELYKQKYCGCIFSEYDRYISSKKVRNTLKECDFAK